MRHRFGSVPTFCGLVLGAALVPLPSAADPVPGTATEQAAPAPAATATQPAETTTTQAPAEQTAPAAAAATTEPAPAGAATDPAQATTTQAPAAEATQQPPAEATTTQPAAAPAVPAKPLLGALARARLATLQASAGDAERQDAAALTAFYLERNDAPLWIADGALGERATLAIAEIKKADDWGLDASAFDLPDVKRTLSEEDAAGAELKLSMAALTYARHARGGRIPDPANQLSSYLDRQPQLLDPKAVLAALVAPGTPDAALRGFHPKQPQFEKLRQKYLEMLKSAEAAKAIVRLPNGPALSPGQRHGNVALLRQRLEVPVPAGTAEAPADETLYDDALATAVKAFQTEKGLTPDGIVGPGTRAALNDIDVPSPEKVRANMEMWRWMPEDPGSTHVWVKIPEFTFQFVKDGKIVHEERIITGLIDKQTPVFSADMDTVTIHPRWNVPDSIKVRELYPSLARGGTYFEKQGLRMSKNGRPVDPYSVDWGSADIRQFDVHQPPGGANVLGQFKFTFHNKHIVYMHDTPTKHLFDQPSRPFSHGCVRVRNPARFAELVLEADKGWTPEQVADLVASNPVENPIQLQSKIPVHTTYFTQRVDEKGELLSFKDVYGHEERVMLALEGRFDAIAKGPDHLAPVRYEKREYASGTSLDAFFNNIFGGF